ncbi:MAG TPA: hypothetical protein VMH06_07690, partial [Thermodesulfovibrionales bacterium]|nr:hypothetical protein [Thermodesulfovibrionales bacterium]
MHNTSISDIFDAFAEDLLEERSARPMIIVGASKVDNLLFEILNNHLLPKLAKANDHDQLLEGWRVNVRPTSFCASIRKSFREELFGMQCTAKKV